MDQVTPEMKALPMSEVWADSNFNCRGQISPIDVVDLMKDIEAKGLIQPVCVAPIKEGDEGYTQGYRFKLIAGFRRHMCHMILKKETILSVIRDDMKDEITARSFNLVENLQRSDLTILQEAKAIEHMHMLGLSDTDLGNEIGMSKGWVQVRIMLLHLPSEVQSEVVSCSIPQSGIRELYTIYNKSGKDACFEAVRNIKDAKAKGIRRPVVKSDGKPKNKKRGRNIAEIREMMGAVQSTIGNCFATRMMAWCSGAIDDKEAFIDLKREAENNGVLFEIPELED